jgi:hypothetical protein
MWMVQLLANTLALPIGVQRVGRENATEERQHYFPGSLVVVASVNGVDFYDCRLYLDGSAVRRWLHFDPAAAYYRSTTKVSRSRRERSVSVGVLF